jgi:hypothetical protein
MHFYDFSPPQAGADLPSVSSQPRLIGFNPCVLHFFSILLYLTKALFGYLLGKIRFKFLSSMAKARMLMPTFGVRGTDYKYAPAEWKKRG